MKYNQSMKASRSRILLITWSFPPLVGPGDFRKYVYPDTRVAICPSVPPWKFFIDCQVNSQSMARDLLLISCSREAVLRPRLRSRQGICTTSRFCATSMECTLLPTITCIDDRPSRFLRRRIRGGQIAANYFIIFIEYMYVKVLPVSAAEVRLGV